MKIKKLTPEDKERIKTNFLNTSFGKSLQQHRLLIFHILSVTGLVPFIVLTIGTFIPNNWSIIVPIINQYPLDKFFGSNVHGYTEYFHTGTWYQDILYSKIDTHHMIDIMCMWIGYSIMVIKTKSFIYPALFSPYVIATHEYGWWVAYIVAHLFLITTTNAWELVYFSNHLTLIYGLIIFAYIPIKGWNRRDFLYVGLVCLFYAGWIATGFHVNWDFNGATPYEFDIPTILTENSSWIYTYAIFLTLVDYTKIRLRWF